MIALFLSLKKTKASDTAKIVKPVLLYSLKMILFSAVALVPVVLLKGKLLALFAGHNRFISQGVPLVLSCLIFGIIGVALLALTKDSILKIVIDLVKSKIGKKAENK